MRTQGKECIYMHLCPWRGCLKHTLLQTKPLHSRYGTVKLRDEWMLHTTRRLLNIGKQRRKLRFGTQWTKGTLLSSSRTWEENPLGSLPCLPYVPAVEVKWVHVELLSKCQKENVCRHSYLHPSGRCVADLSHMITAQHPPVTLERISEVFLILW